MSRKDARQCVPLQMTHHVLLGSVYALFLCDQEKSSSFSTFPTSTLGTDILLFESTQDGINLFSIQDVFV